MKRKLSPRKLLMNLTCTKIITLKRKLKGKEMHMSCKGASALHSLAFLSVPHALIFLLLASSSMSGVARVRMSQRPMEPRALRCWGRIIHLLLTNQSMPTEPMAQVGNLRPMAVRSARLPARRRPQGGMSQRHQFNHARNVKKMKVLFPPFSEKWILIRSFTSHAPAILACISTATFCVAAVPRFSYS